ncbi:MAG TPA: RES family NAD+ phosphorylase [Thermoanaerobaculia bacterium]|nr:RES family NAD+ phosphorylase [Thermoanaerobaculia bacterium]
MVYRLVQAAQAEGVLSGEGARRYGGRWNPAGVAVTYASGSRALAVLEMFVHLSLEARRLRFMMYEISLPDDIKVERYEGPARLWRHQRPTSATQAIGDDWVARGSSLALAVPSVIIPQESNFLLNPGHPGHRQLRVSRPRPFAFDERLWKS